NFIDLSNNGKLFDEPQILNIINKNVDGSGCPENTCLDPLPSHKILMRYLEDLVAIYEGDAKPHSLHTAYNVVLKLEPSHLKFLAKRALLRQRLGFAKDAISDL